MSIMYHTFDELTKRMAQSVMRRAAPKQCGMGLAGMALACFGLANKAQAVDACQINKDCSIFGPSAVCCKFKSGKICSEKVWCRGKGGKF